MEIYRTQVSKNGTRNDPQIRTFSFPAAAAQAQQQQRLSFKRISFLLSTVRKWWELLPKQAAEDRKEIFRELLQGEP